MKNASVCGYAKIFLPKFSPNQDKLGTNEKTKGIENYRQEDQGQHNSEFAKSDTKKNDAVSNLLLVAHAMTEMHSKQSQSAYQESPLLHRKAETEVYNSPSKVERIGDYTKKTCEPFSALESNENFQKPSIRYENQSMNCSGGLRGDFLLISPQNDPRRIKRSRYTSIACSNKIDVIQNVMNAEQSPSEVKIFNNYHSMSNVHISPTLVTSAYAVAAKARMDTYMKSPVSLFCPETGENLTPVSAKLMDFSRKIELNSLDSNDPIFLQMEPRLTNKRRF